MLKTEAERQFYLSAAGIRMWYARSDLPGAAPSPAFHFPLDAEKSSAKVEGPGRVQQPAAPVSDHKPVPQWSGLKAMVSEEEPVPLVAASVEKGETDTAPVIADAVIPHLDLGLWGGGKFVLLSRLSDNASDRLQDELAGNILRAMGDAALSYERFCWPVFRNPHVASGPASLTDSLEALGHRFNDRRTIWLGVVDDSVSGNLEALLGKGLGDPVVNYSHSLSQLATDPERKRGLWGLLKAQVEG